MATALAVGRRLLFVVNIGRFFVSHRLPIAIAAREHGYEVHVATNLDGVDDADTLRTIEAAGVLFHRLHFSRSGSGPFELFRDARALANIFKRVRPDIVHLVTIKPVLVGGIVARFFDVAGVILAIPGRGVVFSAQGARAAVRRLVATLAYRLAYRPAKTRVIVQNTEDREYFIAKRAFRREDVSLIRGSGVDLRRFGYREEPSGTPTIVLASRMLKDKGIAQFVAAAETLRKEGCQARFALVGGPDPGNPRSHSREELAEWSSHGQVEWWGFRNDMDRVFGECHIVCLPTFYGEGVPKVLIEAAASGRAIVTTDTPGCRDIVRHEHNGLLVPPGDSSALAAALRRLIENPEARRAMGKQGSRLAALEFTSEIVVEQTLAIYERLNTCVP